MNFDIATILESHRKYILEHVSTLYENDDAEEAGYGLSAMANAHDRATTRALLDMYRNSNPAATTPIATMVNAAIAKSRKVKPGSKAARDRAIKAGETRRRNLAAKQAGQATATGTPTPGAGGPIVDDSRKQDGGAA